MLTPQYETNQNGKLRKPKFLDFIRISGPKEVEKQEGERYCTRRQLTFFFSIRFYLLSNRNHLALNRHLQILVNGKYLRKDLEKCI